MEERTKRLNVSKVMNQKRREDLVRITSEYGTQLRMNRSIQAEGVFGSIKWNRSYTRARRRGLKGLKLELGLVCCGFNLHKYHLKSIARTEAVG